jgi:outer membrane protein TolC
MPVKVLLAACGLLVAARAGALQPLEEFLGGARKSGVDNAEARALRRQAAAEARAELGRALPRLSLRGDYVRNEFETVLQLPGAGGGPAETVTVTPRDQLDGTATLQVPLVDLASFARIGAARSGARAAERQETFTDLASQSRVAQNYYQLVANVALVGASSRALEVARTGLRIAEERHGAGSTGLLDVDRARAEVERNFQQLASAELQVSLVARELRSLTGLAPEVGGEPPLADDLHEEPPLERFQPADDELPALAAAIESRVAADRQARAQRFVLVPSLDASLTERVSSAEGLAGRDAYWQAVVGLSWSIDLTTLAGIRAQEAAADAARAREERVRLTSRDDIHRAWASVRTHIARSRSARTEAQVSGRAAVLAMERYQAGAAGQLDLLAAQRDAFSADAARIQADADLVNARAQLRLAAGESLLHSPGRSAP